MVTVKAGADFLDFASDGSTSSKSNSTCETFLTVSVKTEL
jgi:hypothetical protein